MSDWRYRTVFLELVWTCVFLNGCAAPRAVPRPLLPGIALDVDAHVVQLDGVICLDRGILEYVAVARGGKEYESVFALDCRPSQLKTALLIAGYREGGLDPTMRGDFAPQADPAAYERPAGAPDRTPYPAGYEEDRLAEPTRARIAVEVRQADGCWERRPLESFLLDRRTARPPEQLTWAFTGSFFRREGERGPEYFIGDVEKSVIALWYDPTALLNLTQDVGNPYRGETVGIELNQQALPAKGTPVRLVLSPAAGG